MRTVGFIYRYIQLNSVLNVVKSEDTDLRSHFCETVRTRSAVCFLLKNIKHLCQLIFEDYG